MGKKRRFLRFAVSGALVLAPLALTACQDEEVETEERTNVGEEPPPEESNTGRVDEADPDLGAEPQPEATNTGRINEAHPEVREEPVETNPVHVEDPEPETAAMGESTRVPSMRTNVGRMH